MLDYIDELILSTLPKNSRQDIREIWDFLRGYGYNLNEEEIQSRIATLEAGGDHNWLHNIGCHHKY
jgi:DNA-binding Lrp family transcriptional regulator